MLFYAAMYFTGFRIKPKRFGTYLAASDQWRKNYFAVSITTSNLFHCEQNTIVETLCVAAGFFILTSYNTPDKGLR